MSKQGADVRRSARAKVLLTASLEWQGSRTPVKVGNLSAHGTLVHGERLPTAAGTPVTFRCGGLVIKGWTAWVRAPYVGIDFDEAIDPEALFRKRGAASAVVIKDLRQPNFKRPGFRQRSLTELEQKIIENWTREDRVGF